MPPAKARPRASARLAAAALSGLLAASAVLGLSGCAVSGGSPANGWPWAEGQAGNVQAAAGHPGGSGAVTAAAATSRIRNHVNGRLEAVVPDISRAVLLIGDSQSEPSDGWPRLALASVGYNVYFCGRGGTGYVASNGATGNYIDALQRGDWLLPSSAPALIVIEGGGNDAASGASNARIAGNAERLIAELKARYPGTRMAMIGTLARGADNGGGRRSEVDALLGSVAGAHGLPFVSVGDWLTKYGLAKDLADSVHMNTAGRAALGGILAGRLHELGLERKPSVEQVPLAAVTWSSSDFQD